MGHNSGRIRDLSQLSGKACELHNEGPVFHPQHLQLKISTWMVMWRTLAWDHGGPLPAWIDNMMEMLLNQFKPTAYGWSLTCSSVPWVELVCALSRMAWICLCEKPIFVQGLHIALSLWKLNPYPTSLETGSIDFEEVFHTYSNKGPLTSQELQILLQNYKSCNKFLATRQPSFRDAILGLRDWWKAEGAPATQPNAYKSHLHLPVQEHWFINPS